MSKFVETCLGEGLRKPKVAGKNITVSSSEPHPGIYPDIYRLSDMLSRINTFSVLFSQYSHLDLPGTRFFVACKKQTELPFVFNHLSGNHETETALSKLLY